MSETFESEFFAGNRKRLRELFTGTAPIVITANGLMQQSSDTAYPFKQDSNFWYLTGINHPNITLVIDRDKEYLILPEQSEIREYFDGAVEPKQLQKISGIEDILYVKQGWKRLGSRIKKVTSLATLAPAPHFIESLGMYVNPARANMFERIKTYKKDIELLDLNQHLARMRMVKQPAELAALKQAIQLTANGLKKVQRKYMRGAYRNEFEIELDLTRSFNLKGGQGHSFTPIVAAGAKACTIHPQGNFGPIDSQPLLLDVGAQFAGYAADISRTWTAKDNKRFQAVHSAVDEASSYAMSLLKPGVVMKKYEKAVEHYMGEKLRALGLIKNIESDEIRKFFPHATSHFLGIDVHDKGDYARPLEPGVVLTVEPGIYIKEEGIGVRIENDVLITKKGCKNLSSMLP